MINSIQNNSTMTANSSTSSKTTNDLSAQFLNLFIAQIKNQDPLNPMDPTATTTQLAQLNQVSTLNDIKNQISSLSSVLDNSSLSQMSAYINKNISYMADTLGADKKLNITFQENTIFKDKDGKILAQYEKGTQDINTPNISGIVYAYPSVQVNDVVTGISKVDSVWNLNTLSTQQVSVNDLIKIGA